MPESKIDRISELPEDLLIVILGLVPTKDAVATMFLSKLWLSVWTMVRTLEYKDDVDDDDTKRSTWWFLDKSLQLHKAPLIDDLCVELGPRCPSDVDVGKWVAHAVDRLVLSLTFSLLWSADPTSLPKSLYTSHSLRQLTLSHKILLDTPSSCCLPSLLVLELSFVVYKDEASLVRFLSSCPVLCHLVVRRKGEDNVTKFSVKVPSLYHLWYMKSIELPDNSDTDGSLVVDTPALKKLTISDFAGDSSSVESMPCLEEASIDVESLACSATLIRSLSPLLSLELYFTDDLVTRFSTINLPRLLELRISPRKLNWLKPLLLLLGNAPKLKNLVVFHDFMHRPKDLRLSWDKTSTVPGCLSSQLEIFEWIEYGATEEEQGFLTYILANSKVLKTATITLSPAIDTREEKDLIIKELEEIPRVSTASQLMFA